MKKNISFINRGPDVEALIENKRNSLNPFMNGYRPAHRIKEDYLTTGEQNYYNKDKLFYGETALGTIKFLTPEYYPNSISVGQKIYFQEGKRITGCATITRIFNEQLLKID